MDEKQEAFLDELDDFITRVKGLKQFKGKASVIRALERIPERAVFNK